MADLQSDPRLDPRIKALLAAVPTVEPTDAIDRDQIVAEANTPQALAAAEGFGALMDLCDTEEAAPSAGLRIERRDGIATGHGSLINLAVIRPDHDEPVPGVVYLHGGGMANLSCFDGMYRGWGKLIAANGVAVVMVDFRNAVVPSSVPEVAPFPAGLDDCVAGIRWVAQHTTELGIDPEHLIVAGESGGGNLTLASAMRMARDGDIGIVSGLYALCPYIAGQWDRGDLPSAVENDGILLNVLSNRGRMAYGIEAFEARDPLAWPLFATEADVAGLPRTMISVNECDPLRDEGIAFYRLLLAAGVPARCRQVMGTMHGVEIFTIACPEISRDTARDLAAFAAG